MWARRPLAAVALLCVLLCISSFATVAASAATLTSVWGSHAIFTAECERILSSSGAAPSWREIYHAWRGYTSFSNERKWSASNALPEDVTSCPRPINGLDYYYSQDSAQMCLRTNGPSDCPCASDAPSAEEVLDLLKSDEIPNILTGLLVGNMHNLLPSSETDEQIYVNIMKKFRKEWYSGKKWHLATMNNVSEILPMTLHALGPLHNMDAFGGLCDELYNAALTLVKNGSGSLLPDAAGLIDGTPKLSTEDLVMLVNSGVPLLQQLGGDNIDIVGVVRIAETLRMVASLPGAPVMVALKPQVSEAPLDKLFVSVQNVLGQNITPTDVSVESLRATRNKGTDLSDSVSWKATAPEELNFSVGLSRGKYSIELKVTTGESSTHTLTSSLIVTEDFSVNGVSVAVNPRDSKVSYTNVKEEKAFKGTATSLDVFSVRFSVGASRKPHQAFLSLVNEKTKHSVIYPANIDSSSSALDYTVSVNFANELETLRYASGKYIASLFIGDASATTPVSFVIGNLDLNLPEAPKETYSLYKKALLHGSDVALAPLPEIVHQMRPPAKRAPAPVALLFTGVIIVGLVAFIVLAFTKAQGNIKGLSSAPLLFVLLLLNLFAILVLIAVYWLSLLPLTFYTMLKIQILLVTSLMVLAYFSVNKSVVETNKQKTA